MIGLEGYLCYFQLSSEFIFRKIYYPYCNFDTRKNLTCYCSVALVENTLSGSFTTLETSTTSRVWKVVRPPWGLFSCPWRQIRRHLVRRDKIAQIFCSQESQPCYSTKNGRSTKRLSPTSPSMSRVKLQLVSYSLCPLRLESIVSSKGWPSFRNFNSNR